MRKFFVAALILTSLFLTPMQALAQSPMPLLHQASNFGLPENALEESDQRRRDSVVFRLDDGRKVLIISRGVNYQRPDGALVKPDLSFSDALDRPVSDSDTKATIVGRSLVVSDQDDRGLIFELPATPTRNRDKLTYTDRGISWAYIKKNDGVKLEGVVSTSRGEQTYTFPYIAPAVLEMTSSGSIRGNGFTIPRPTVRDASGRVFRFDWVLELDSLAFTFNDAGMALPYTIDPTTNFDVDATTDDVTTSGGSIAYGPPACTTVTDGAANLNMSKSDNVTSYGVEVSYIQWDTSSIPDTATIDSAELIVGGVIIAQDDDARNITGEWYSTSNWPIDCSDHSATVDTTAFDVDVTSFASPVTLSNPTTISKTGYTGLRMGISGGLPLGQNEIQFDSFDDGSGSPPRLAVTYTEMASSIITLLATGVTSGEHTLRLVGDSSGIELFLDGDSQDTHGAQVTVFDNSNDYSLFTNNAMPYVEYIKLTTEGVLGLWYQIDGLPDHELVDHSGQGNDTIAYYPETIAGFTSVLQPLEATGVTAAITGSGTGNFVPSVDDVGNAAEGGEYLIAPSNLVFQFLDYVATQFEIPYQGVLTMFAFVATALVGLITYGTFRSLHIMWGVMIAVSVLLIVMGGGLWGWIVPVTFAFLTIGYLWYKRVSV